MRELRPICELCKQPLLSNSLDGRICSFEYTAGANSVVKLLGDMCPKCGRDVVLDSIEPANGEPSSGRPPAEVRTGQPTVDAAQVPASAANNGRQTKAKR